MNAPQITWSWQISLGNITTFAGMVAVASLAWGDVRHSDALQTREIEELKADATRTLARLAASDVADARSDARMVRIEELMTEVREVLRDLNRREQP